MRKLMVLMLLATSATPALARPNFNDGADERPARAERSAEVRGPRADAPRAEAPARVEFRGPRSGGGGDQPQAFDRGPRGAGGGWIRPTGGGEQPRAVDPVAVQRWRDRQPPTTFVQPSGETPQRWADHVRTPDDRRWTGTRDGVTVTRGAPAPSGDRRWDGTRNGTWTGTRDGSWNGTRYGTYNGGTRDSHRRWTNDWRRDSRYDWRSYRDRNRFTFRIGAYYDPFGYGYRPLNIGYNLYPGYYQSNYWLDDPWQYRLPPVYGPYRWIRYYNDAVLVDIYSGEVVDVIRDFFW